MKGKIISLAVSGVLLLLLCSGAFADIIKFFAWLFTLQYSAPETSIAGGIIVRILTFVVSYSLVGIIFNFIGWFNSKIMSLFYFIISTLVFFALAYLVWTIEQYILIIGIILGVIALCSIVFIILWFAFLKKKFAASKTENQENEYEN